MDITKKIGDLINEMALTLEPGQEKLLVYHSTASFHNLKQIITSGQFDSVVSDFNQKIGHARLSTSPSLKSQLRDWFFGPYILEIETVRERQPLQTEYVLYNTDPYRFTRWAIAFNYPHAHAPDLVWFPISDINTFDHQPYDTRVLEAAAKGSGIASSWMMDFYDGHWPKFEQIFGQHVDAYIGQQLEGGRKLTKDEIPGVKDAHKSIHDTFRSLRGPDWNRQYRKQLYGIE